MAGALDLLAQQGGFKGQAEMARLVARAKMNTAEAIEAFKDWQRNDGSKEGLLPLLPEDIQAEVAPDWKRPE